MRTPEKITTYKCDACEERTAVRIVCDLCGLRLCPECKPVRDHAANAFRRALIPGTARSAAEMFPDTPCYGGAK